MIRKKKRSVETEKFDFKPFSQMTEASNTSQRTIINHTNETETETETENTQKEVTINQSQTFDIAQHHDNFHRAVQRIVARLEQSSLVHINPFTYCMHVMKHMGQLTKIHNYTDQNHLSLMVSQLGSYYATHIETALKYLEPKFATGNSCEYIRELNNLAKNFKFHSNNPDCKETHKKALMELYKQAIETKLNYLEYIKDDKHRRRKRVGAYLQLAPSST